ncbi:MAG: 2-isopropylmalate synthase [Acidobacteriota bacterium]|nr:2-isopropylmalate synthase [Acidobacteriota bacterium]MDH3524140.1 2-isopropylmalate synthase [Acidobacteriota bacterium]
MALQESELIFDWNRDGGEDMKPARGAVELNDETLRDGLQSPSVTSPPIEDKVRILHLMAQLGIESANLGLPGAGPHVVADVTQLAREIVDHRLPVAANCAARTLEADILPIVEISQATGLAIEVACFIGSSPIRQFTENWDLARLVGLTRDAVDLAVRHGLPVMYVTEDTTRARPEDLRALYTAAVEAGARRICVADTVGHATPRGVDRLVRFLRGVVDATGEDVKVDWHGHRDRGLSVINALAAAVAGADRLHGTALGIGERVGNTAIDLLMVNLQLLGWSHRKLERLPEYCRLVAATTGVPLPDNYPVVGRDAFRTATGVHAAAIIKARAKGHDWLADRIYSGVPAALVGRRQRVEIGPMCGKSNVIFWLEEHGIEPRPDLVETVFRRAKESDRLLEAEEILELCRAGGVPAA